MDRGTHHIYQQRHNVPEPGVLSRRTHGHVIRLLIASSSHLAEPFDSFRQRDEVLLFRLKTNERLPPVREKLT